MRALKPETILFVSIFQVIRFYFMKAMWKTIKWLTLLNLVLLFIYLIFNMIKY